VTATVRLPTARARCGIVAATATEPARCTLRTINERIIIIIIIIIIRPHRNASCDLTLSRSAVCVRACLHAWHVLVIPQKRMNRSTCSYRRVGSWCPRNQLTGSVARSVGDKGKRVFARGDRSRRPIAPTIASSCNHPVRVSNLVLQTDATRYKAGCACTSAPVTSDIVRCRFVETLMTFPAPTGRRQQIR